ncbi:hypothetical protein ACVWWK_003383 [Bradyrhizobium sp. LB9.1b]
MAEDQLKTGNYIDKMGAFATLRTCGSALSEDEVPSTISNSFLIYLRNLKIEKPAIRDHPEPDDDEQ